MKPSSRYLGIDIGGTKTAVSLSSPEEGVLRKKRFTTNGPRGPEQAFDQMLALGKDLSQGEKIRGVGVSVGAMFNPSEGSFGEAPHLPGWTGFPVNETFEKAFSLPVRADNDANACALAEWRYGAAQGTKHLAFCTFGTGFGAGLILNGHLYRGSSNLAGEIGATRLAEAGPAIRSKPGCLEGFASGAGIAALVDEMRPGWTEPTSLVTGSSAREVAEAARTGDLLARAILEKSGDALGRGLAILVDLLNLEIVVIGSIFARAEDLLRPSFEKAFAHDAMPATRRDCRVVPAALGDEVGDYGALVLAVDAARLHERGN